MSGLGMEIRLGSSVVELPGVLDGALKIGACGKT